MNIILPSMFADIPQQLPKELCQTLFENPTVRVERILSKGHSSPDQSWYDQKQTEWVLLLQGQARLSFVNGDAIAMKPGDYLLLQPHCKHRVDWTSTDPVCVWLAIHIFSDSPNADA